MSEIFLVTLHFLNISVALWKKLPLGFYGCYGSY